MTVRVGIVGWGEAGRIHASHLASAGAEFSGVVSRRKNPDLDVPVFHALDDMLPHIDAVTIAVPNHLHASLCLQSVRAGKAVLVEKPLCIDKGELEELEAVLPNMKVPVHLGYRLRWNPTMQRLRGRIKGLRRISCIYRIGIEQLASGKDWTRELSKTGGGFFTIGIHALDLVRWLSGARGEALSNFTASAEYRNHSANFPLCVSLSGTLPSGVKIVAGADLRGDSEFELKLVVDAESGIYPDPSLIPPKFEDEEIEYRALIHHFIQAVEHGTWNQKEFDEIIQTHRELIVARELVSR